MINAYNQMYHNHLSAVSCQLPKALLLKKSNNIKDSSICAQYERKNIILPWSSIDQWVWLTQTMLDSTCLDGSHWLIGTACNTINISAPTNTYSVPQKSPPYIFFKKLAKNQLIWMIFGIHKHDFGHFQRSMPNIPIPISVLRCIVSGTVVELPPQKRIMTTRFCEWRELLLATTTQ